MALEYELKYTADEDTLSSIARVLPPASQELDMHTTYLTPPPEILPPAAIPCACARRTSAPLPR